MTTGKTVTMFIWTHTFYEGAGWAHGPLPPTVLQEPVFGSKIEKVYCVLNAKLLSLPSLPKPAPTPNGIVQQGAAHSPFHSQCTLSRVVKTSLSPGLQPSSHKEGEWVAGEFGTILNPKP